MGESRDVQNFKFKQIRKLRIFNTRLPLSYEVINLLAVSNLYDLIFVGSVQGFKVFKLDDILNLEHHKDINRTIAESYKSKDIILSSQPLHLALSCDDLTLSVCHSKEGDCNCYIYDVSSFFQSDYGLIEPVASIRLCSNAAVTLMDLIWNPTTNNMFAVCLSDGTVINYNKNEKLVNIVGSLKSDATAICWSPKGKQLIVGKGNGEMIQYKPNLQAVKTIPVPGIFENSCSVVNVLWISSFSFAVAYTFPNWNEEGINLLIIDIPKNSSPVFTPFEDVCFSSCNENRRRYLMIHQSQWRVIFCTSSNSMEVGVLGFSNENVWEQWFLEDSGRAELPLDGKDEMYPIGMAINYNSTKAIPIDDNVSLPPMPILLLLSTKGFLCPFHVINCATNTPSLQKRAQSLKSIKMEQMQPNSGISTTAVPFAKTEPLFVDAPPMLSNELSAAVTLVEKCFPATIGTPQLFSESKIAVITTNAVVLPESMSSPVSTFCTLKTSTVSKVNQKSAFQPPPVIHKRTNQIRDNDANITILDTTNSTNNLFFINLYTNCIVEEITNFSNELIQLKTKTSKLKIFPNQNVLLLLTEELEIFQKFSKDITTTSMSLNQDVHSLKLRLLETFAMLDEAISLQSRNVDMRFRQLLRNRSLDLYKVKKMKELRSLYYYIQSQVNEVDNKLNEISSSEKKSIQFSNFYLPTSETIYQSICNMQNIIESTAFKLGQLKELMDEVQIKGFVPYSKVVANLSNKMKQGDADSLNERFNKIRLDSQLSMKQKEISTEKETLLREMLEHRSVMPIRSSVPGSVFGLSMPEIVLNANRARTTSSASAVPSANVTFAHPGMMSTPISNSFRPLKTTLHPSASIPTTRPMSPVQSRSPFSLPGGEKTIHSLPNSDVKSSDPLKIISSNSKSSSTSSISSSAMCDKLFSVGAMTVNKSDQSSGITFGNKSSSAAAIVFGTIKVSTSDSPDSSLSLFKFGNKNIPEFQFQPVEAKSKTFLGNTDKSERIIATSLKAKLKSNEDKSSFTLETVLDDVTPPSTPSEDEDDKEETDEEHDKCSDDGRDEDLEGVVIEEIFESEETDRENTLAEDDAKNNSNENGQKLKILTTEYEDLHNISNLPLNAKTCEQTKPTEKPTELLLRSSESAAVKEMESSSRTSMTFMTNSSKPLLTPNTLRLKVSNFSFRQTTTEAAPLNVLQDQIGFQYKQGSQPLACGGALTSLSQKPVAQEVGSTAFLKPVVTEPSSSKASNSAIPALTSSTKVFKLPPSQTLLLGQVTTTNAVGAINFGPTNCSSSHTFGTTTKHIFSPSAITTSMPTFDSFGPSSFAIATSVSATATSNSAFGSSVSDASVYGTAAFGQKSSFGQSIDNAPLFGQSPLTSDQSRSWTFGETDNAIFGQNLSTTPSFGTLNSTNTFGQGSFFSGLGAKPNPENTNKNVFGERSSFGSPGNTNLFGNQRQSKFGLTGASFTSPIGSFSGGCSSVANAGFGGFQTHQQQQQTPSKLNEFGTPPPFGQQPAFGGGPTFGGSPGTISPFGSSSMAFGSTAFANTQNTSFGTMALQQQSTTTFGSLAHQARNVFGNQNFEAEQFGQQQQRLHFGSSSNFSSPNSECNPSSSFSQWR